MNSSNTSTTKSDDGNSHNMVNWLYKFVDDRYVILYQLGKGAQASVWLTYDMNDCKYYAIKIGFTSENIYDMCVRESSSYDKFAKIGCTSSHLINIVRSFDYENSASNLSNNSGSCTNTSNTDADISASSSAHVNHCIVMELMGYSLYDYIDRHGVICGQRLQDVVKKVLYGLIPLHDNMIVHTDIKPENILTDVRSATVNEIIATIDWDKVYGDAYSSVYKKSIPLSITKLDTHGYKAVVRKQKSTPVPKSAKPAPKSVSKPAPKSASKSAPKSAQKPMQRPATRTEIICDKALQDCIRDMLSNMFQHYYVICNTYATNDNDNDDNNNDNNNNNDADTVSEHCSQPCHNDCDHTTDTLSDMLAYSDDDSFAISTLRCATTTSSNDDIHERVNDIVNGTKGRNANDTDMQIKITDITGCAFLTATNPTDDAQKYLGSSYYHPPEILLRLKYNTSADMWALGCTIYELITNSILFGYHSYKGNERRYHLHQIMHTLGYIPPHMIESSSDSDLLFTADKTRVKGCNSIEPRDKRVAVTIDKLRELYGGDILTDSVFKIMMGCLEIDPEKRMSAREAIKLIEEDITGGGGECNLDDQPAS